MNILLENTNLIHTTILGAERIKKNLKIDVEDVVKYCIDIIEDKECYIIRKGKNWYCELGKTIITVNAYNYCIITAHLK